MLGQVEFFWWTFNMPTDHAEVSLTDVRAKMMSWVAWWSPEFHRFMPFNTHSSPSATAVVSRNVASEP